MKEQQRHNWEQLYLPLTDESRDGKRQLDPTICKEVTRLLGLLLSECMKLSFQPHGDRADYWPRDPRRAG
jgi:hypothetical protein